ncbi:MAG: putative phosphohydrolase [Rhodoglobus sp.]|nr:putative phosphohydrolase [Rhodoglobus sp.]
MIVLRFSSLDDETISAHDALIADEGFAWWGWWKKRHEPWPDSGTLSRIGRARQIGLVDRAAELYYVASSRDMVHASGDVISSPDSAHSPRYYSDALLPMWLKFVRIERLSANEWAEKFGRVPEGDSTLFEQSPQELSRSAGGAPVRFSNAPESRTAILHISDLHFGDDHAYSGQHTIDNSIELLDNLVRDLPSAPAVVVVSGDLTTRGGQAGLDAALEFLERLALRLQLPRDNIIVVPGNHDILVDDLDDRKDFDNEGPFRTFVEDFYGEPVALERIHLVTLSDGRKFAFGLVNSSRPRTSRLMDYGYVGRDRAAPIMDLLARLADQGCITFFVLHHHLQSAQGFEEPIINRPVSITLDAGELVSSAARSNVTAILHGHQHLPFVGSATRAAEFSHSGPTPLPPTTRAVPTLGAGSLSAGISRLGDELRDNSFSFYEVLENELRIRVYRLNPNQYSSLIWDFHI